jgi:hypothetical protein
VIHIVIPNNRIKTDVNQAQGLLGYIRSCCYELEAKYGAVPYWLVIKYIQMENVDVLPAAFGIPSTIFINGVLIPRLWNYDKSSTKIIIKAAVAHECLHWNFHLTNNHPENEEDLCEKFGADEVGMTVPELQTLDWKVFSGAFKTWLE